MTTEEMEHELRDLKQQLALLQKEHANTRNGWLYWMRITGFVLSVFGFAFLGGVWESHPGDHPSAIAGTFVVMAILMLVLGFWLCLWSLRPMAERLMSSAPK